MSFVKASPKAASLLQLCSFFHHSGISEDIFWRALSTTAGKLYGAETGQKAMNFLTQFTAHNKVWDQYIFSTAINELASYSLITFTNEQQYSFHPLVHAWSRDR